MKVQRLYVVALLGTLLFISWLQATVQQDTLSEDSRDSTLAEADEKKNDNQLSVPAPVFEAHHPVPLSRRQPESGHPLHDRGTIQTPTYERVVLAGSNISITCPHFVILTAQQQQQPPPPPLTTTATTKEITLTGEALSLGGPTLDDTFDVKEQEKTLYDSSSLNEAEHSRVKWFRNHVSLVNLNYLHHSCRNKTARSDKTLSENNAQTAISETELNQATELSPSVGREANDDRRTQKGDSSSEDQNVSIGHATASRLALESTTSENVNEQVTSRKCSNLQSNFAAQPETQWYVNKFGELIINGVPGHFAGKYTCLVLGKQSDVLLHVAVDNDAAPSTPSRYWDSGETDARTRRRRHEPLQSPDETYEKATNRELTLTTGSRQIATGSELKTSTSTFPGPANSKPIAMNDHHKSEKNLVQSSLLRIFQSSGHPDRYPQFNGESMEMTDRKDDGKSVSGNSRDWWNDAPNQMLAPVHTVRIETIQLNDLKLIPGLIYTSQRLHCPISRRDSFHRDFVPALIRTLCSQSNTSRPPQSVLELEKCQALVRGILRTTMPSDDQSGVDCDTSILELAWFKDGRQLEFDSNGKGTEAGPNVRLINFRDQLNSSSRLADTSGDKNGVPNIEMLSTKNGAESKLRPTKWICPSIGRTLEIEGVRKDSAGHFSCALKLSTVKLRRSILDTRRGAKREELIPASASADKSCCDEAGQSVKIVQIPGPPSAPVEANETIEDGIQYTEFSTRRAETQAEGVPANLAAHSMVEGINLLESIAKEITEFRGNPTNHTDFLSKLGHPWAIVQTFSLIVLERSAETCDLWSTICAASSAYSRRKWLNFKRLKHNLARSELHRPIERQSDAAVLLLPASDQYNPSSNAQTLYTEAAFVGPPESQTQHHQESMDHLSRRLNANLDRSIVPAGIANEKSRGWARRPSKQQQQLDWPMMVLGYPTEAAAMAAATATALDHDQAANHDEESANSLAASKATGHDQSSHQIDAQQLTINQSWDKWRLNNASESGLNVTSVAGQQRRLAPHESSSGAGSGLSSAASATAATAPVAAVAAPLGTPFNYANERNLRPTVEGANKNGIMATHGLARSKRSSTMESGHGIDISNETEIKELITQLGPRGSGLTSDIEYQAERQRELVPPTETNDQATRYRVSQRFSNDDAPPPPTSPPGNDDAGNTADGGLQVESASGFAQPIGNSAGETYGSASSSSPQAPPDLTQLGRQDGIGRFKQVPTDDTDSTETASIDGPELDNNDRLDDDLMWAAGQYLYMHMRAIAGSPLFGAEVSVEWSNERVNNTDSYTALNHDFAGAANNNNNNNDDDDDSENNRPSHERIRDTSPFATIDVIPGQNLHLQCTAHALGRLPEVNWYKFIGEGPSISQIGPANQARKIDGQFYWPIQQLDLLERDDEFERASNGHKTFVQSQTTTVFNNLVNQTFTVVKGLQLSEYNPSSSGALKARRPLSGLDGGDHNLYACIVDADVRHNYATIGVNFRDSASRMPVELSKRLQAKAIFERNQGARGSGGGGNVGVGGGRKFREPRHLSSSSSSKGQHSFDSLLDDRIDGSGSNFKEGPEFPTTTATTLSIMIVVMFSSLLGLVFLTLKSYQRLTSMQFEYSLNDYIGKQNELHTGDEVALCENNGNQRMKDYAKCLMIEDDLASMMARNSRCLCHLGASMHDDMPVYCNDNVSTGDYVTDTATRQSSTDDERYRALSDARFTPDGSVIGVIVQPDCCLIQLEPDCNDERGVLPKPAKTTTTTTTFDDNSNKRHQIDGSERPATITMVENPLNREPPALFVTSLNNQRDSDPIQAL